MKVCERICAHVLATCALAVTFWSLGCAREGNNLPLDKSTAQASLTKFLDTWSQGQKPDSLESLSPRIVGRDPDWDAGKKLVRYALGATSEDGSNLHVKADLVVAQGQGPESKLSVEYIVGTSPVITVFRME
ncbi:MAG: hypothetical protein U0939_02615 [Pirellulales bacterium]